MASGQYRRKSGQIPAFGDWENAGGLPITQYFECARQAGLPRCSCSGACAGSATGGGGVAGAYDSGFTKSQPRRMYSAPQPKVIRGYGEEFSSVNERKSHFRARNFIDSSRDRSFTHDKYYSKQGYDSSLVSQKVSFTCTKPVDEDLYKIPSEHLRNSKRKNVFGFFSRCMVPPCSV